MEVTVDQFGRILIPKKLRQALRLEPGTKLNLTISDGHLQATVPSAEPRIVREGKMLYLVSDQPCDIDIVKLIHDDREAYMRYKAGLDEDE